MQKPINIGVSEEIHASIKKISADHDMQTHTAQANITGTAREILHLVCHLNDLPGVDKLRDRGWTLKQIIQKAVFKQVED